MSEQPDTAPSASPPGALSRFAHRAEDLMHDAEHAGTEAAAVVSKVDTALQADLKDHTGTAFALYEEVLAKARTLDPQGAAAMAALLPRVLVIAANAARITSGVLAAI